MVQINTKITRKVGYVEDGKPRPLYTRYHRNTVQRDLIDQGYYVDVETHQPVKADYHVTAGNYAPGELPQPNTDPDQLRADLEAFGFCLIADALSPEKLAEFRQRLDEQAAGERAAGIGSFSSVDPGGIPTNQFVVALVNKGQCFADAVEMSERSIQQGPLLDQLMTEVLGQSFICNSAAAALAGPGGTPQALHCGQSMIPKPWPPWPYECFLGFLLDDFTENNGGTLVIPRSHKILSEVGTDPIPELPPTANVTAPAGTAMIMDGRLVHGTGANFSDELRRLIILTYHKPFIRQQEQWQLTLSESVYENASPKLLERLGFQAWHGGLGGFEGNGEGSVAPLRDNYVAVGELNANGEVIDEAVNTDYYLREKRGEYSEKMLRRMRETGQLLGKL
ncbi:MAG: phytanoyl-CoA dioxygenase family protein [Pseudomonadota bacterium]